MEKPFLRRSTWQGPVRAVILDLAGTALDCGSRGPVAVFERAFAEFDIEPTVDECRGPMGREKREHVATMLAMPRLAALWREKHGSEPDEAATDAVFARVLELMPDVLADYAKPVPGCVEAMERLRGMGIKIGACTGYSRTMMKKMLPKAREFGFEPDFVIASDEVPAGRPWPWMCYQIMTRLQAYPPEAVLKVGDTVADIEEGINAGLVPVAVTRTGNAFGLDEAELASLPEAEAARMARELEDRFRRAGAEFVLGSVAQLPDLCARIGRGQNNF